MKSNLIGSEQKTMENSISLGLLHGLVYGIVPVAPWFVALKRYLLEGKEKGQLAVAGTIAGQVTLLALTFSVGVKYFGFGIILSLHSSF